MANLVAKRCSTIADPQIRELIWFVQLISHTEGGLAKLATDLRKLFPQRLATKSMQLFGFEKGKIYNADQVRKVRMEISGGQSRFKLMGERQPFYDDEDNEISLPDNAPDKYPASAFVEFCAAAAAELEQDLAKLCLDPGMKNLWLWYFPTIEESLRDYVSQWIEKQNANRVVTALGEKVCGVLNYCLRTRRMALIDGHARTGKSFSAKAWCESHPGLARYVQVPSSNDDIGFFRAIAKSLGVSINLNSKAQQLRDRIEEVLQTGNLMLVLDEAHYLWPQGNYREALPARVNWLMTALVNHNVPVALITTPQFLRAQKRIEERTSWTSEQFIGRIYHYEELPDSLSAEDLSRVSKSLLPEADEKTIELLTVYAQSSAKYLAGIDAVICRAKYLAQEEHRSRVNGSDVKRAIKESVIPSDSALAQAMEAPARNKRRRAIAPAAQPLQPHFRGNAASAQSPLKNNFAERKSALVPDAMETPTRGNLQDA
jgi:hypothetical protein